MSVNDSWTPSPPDQSAAIRMLAALAQANRLNVYRQLIRASPRGLRPGEIAEALGTRPNTLSFHLKELLNCGLVSQQREGRNLRYTADIQKMQSLISFLLDECCDGEACIDIPGVRRSGLKPPAASAEARLPACGSGRKSDPRSLPGR